MERGGHQYQYLKLADDIENRINSGSFRAGDRLPSLRSLHSRTGLSISTVYQAYMELENRGMVEPREKSGYFVKPRFQYELPPLEIKKLKPRPQRVEVNLLAESIHNAIADPDMVPFGAAVPSMDLLPLKQLAASLRSVSGRYMKKKEMNYGNPTGAPELKREIVKRALGYEEIIDEEEVVITNGCMDAIHLCLRAVAGPGDTILVESPTFTCYLQLIEDLNMLALEVPADPQTGLDLDMVRAALDRHDVKACIVCPSFQNPLGFEMPATAKKELVELCSRREIPVIEDDIYGDLHFGDARPRTMKSFDTQGMVLYCSSFSKTLAPDLRVGWTLPGRYLKKVKRIKFNTVIASSKFNQLIVADFLHNGCYERHLRRLRHALINQVGNMSLAISRDFPPGTRISSPRGGYVLWVELPEEVDGLELFYEAKRNGIFIIPGVICTSTDRYGNCIRISCGHPWNERWAEGLRKLGALISSSVRGSQRPV
ncbi:MAG: PLP-dependent aminotransferase family protein [Deltaproteobacteria bacterium]|nr:PLP-dependent aminotransferase family protein [Deltaproteobacteria bacterium]